MTEGRNIVFVVLQHHNCRLGTGHLSPQANERQVGEDGIHGGRWTLKVTAAADMDLGILSHIDHKR